MFARLSINTFFHIIFYVFLCISSCAVAEGFLAETVVATLRGLHSIEQITCGGKVLCYDTRTKTSAWQSAFYIRQVQIDTLIAITIEDTCIYAAPNQQFYLSLLNTWRAASALQPGDTLLSLTSSGQSTTYVIDAVDRVHGEYTVHQLFVPHYHTFCVSERTIVVHNVPFLASISTIAPPVVVSIWSAIAALVTKAGLAFTTHQAIGLAAGTAMTMGASLSRDALRHKSAKELSPAAAPGTTIAQTEALIVNNDVTYSYHERRAMPAMNDNAHLIVPQQKPGPYGPDKLPILVTYYDARGNVLKGRELAQAKRADIIRRKECGQIKPSYKRPTETKSTCPAPLLPPPEQNTVCPTSNLAQEIPKTPCNTARAYDTALAAAQCATSMQTAPAPVQAQQQPCTVNNQENVTNNPCAASSQAVSDHGTCLMANKVPQKPDEIPKSVETAPSIETGLKRAYEIVGKVDESTGLPHLGKQGELIGKIVGQSYHNGRVLVRIDHDQKLGTHINVDDFRKGKSEANGAVSTHIVIPVSIDELQKFLQHYNTEASIKLAQDRFNKADDSPTKARSLTYLSALQKQLLYNKLGNHGVVPDDWHSPNQ